ncbi:MAG: prolipoprotein diacylglyceryl transferase [Gemmatimonadetes bacterium]|nr:prolipoprotein diacylglyceryl transferase [Gemmatimonadota bacterium]NNM06008.1 prolipoprotein diacylglyceryl transferase [Gemmatimonadota bacterium]
MFPYLFRLPDWVPLLGGQPITSFGVMLFLAFLAAGAVHRSETKRIGGDPEVTWDLLFMAIIGGILGAKIYYIFLNFPQLIADPAGLIFARGGLVWYGGLIGGLVLVVWQIRKKGLGLAQQADMIAPGLALAYGVGRIGCFLVGDDWGRPTGSWVGIAFPNGAPPTRVDIIERDFGIQVDPELVARFGDIVPVHPTQLYEVGLSTLIFLLLWSIRRHNHSKGWLFMLWLALAGAERFLVEFFRAKDDRFFGFLTLAQIISLTLVAVGLVGVSRLRLVGAGPNDAPSEA